MQLLNSFAPLKRCVNFMILDREKREICVNFKMLSGWTPCNKFFTTNPQVQSFQKECPDFEWSQFKNYSRYLHN